MKLVSCLFVLTLLPLCAFLFMLQFPSCTPIFFELNVIFSFPFLNVYVIYVLVSLNLRFASLSVFLIMTKGICILSREQSILSTHVMRRNTQILSICIFLYYLPKTCVVIIKERENVELCACRFNHEVIKAKQDIHRPVNTMVLMMTVGCNF